jgi:hypothetical protein
MAKKKKKKKKKKKTRDLEILKYKQTAKTPKKNDQHSKIN